MARTLTLAEARKVKARLEEFVRGRGISWYEFTNGAGLPHPTTSSWRNTTKETLPSAAMLIRLAEHYDLSIDWLLLGVGGSVLETTRSVATLGHDLREHVESTLQIAKDARGEGDRNALPSEEGMVLMVVEECRQRVADARNRWWAGLPIALAERLQSETNLKKRARLGAQIAKLVLHQARRAADVSEDRVSPRARA